MEQNMAEGSMQIMDNLMSIPLVADVIALSVTLGLASGGIMIAIRFLQAPITRLWGILYRRYTRNIDFHKNYSPRITYSYVLEWMEKNTKEKYFVRNYKVQSLDDRNGVSKPGPVPGWGSVFLKIEGFGIMKMTRSIVAASMTNEEVETLQLTFYFATEETIQRFVSVLYADYLTDRAVSRVSVYTQSGPCSLSDAGYVKSTTLPPLEAGGIEFMEDIEKFIGMKRFYHDKGLPHKRGYLLYGPPGTGKSSLIAHAAVTLHRNVIMLDGLGDISQILNNLAGNLVVIEDMDLTAIGSVSRQEQPEIDMGNVATPVTTNKPSSSDSSQVLPRQRLRELMNAMDGCVESDDIIFIFTSNNPEVIEPALLRAGRIDRLIEIGHYTQQNQLTHFNNFYGENRGLAPDQQLPRRTCAEMQNLCLSHIMDSDAAWDALHNPVHKPLSAKLHSVA